jgi:hypothetical protein
MNQSESLNLAIRNYFKCDRCDETLINNLVRIIDNDIR